MHISRQGLSDHQLALVGGSHREGAGVAAISRRNARPQQGATLKNIIVQGLDSILEGEGSRQDFPRVTKFPLRKQSLHGGGHILVASPDTIGCEKARQRLLNAVDLDDIILDLNRGVSADILGAKLHLARHGVSVAFMAAKVRQSIRVLLVERDDRHVDQRFRLFQRTLGGKLDAIQVRGIVETDAVDEVEVGLRLRELHHLTGKDNFFLIHTPFTSFLLCLTAAHKRCRYGFKTYSYIQNGGAFFAPPSDIRELPGHRETSLYVWSYSCFSWAAGSSDFGLPPELSESFELPEAVV